MVAYPLAVRLSAQRWKDDLLPRIDEIRVTGANIRSVGLDYSHPIGSDLVLAERAAEDSFEMLAGDAPQVISSHHLVDMGGSWIEPGRVFGLENRTVDRFIG